MKSILSSSLGFCFVLGAASPIALAHDHAKEMWEKCDTDKDGSISKEEFIKSKQEHFRKADKNGDGKISKEEHKEVMSRMKDKMDD